MPTFLSKTDFKQAMLSLSYYRFVNPPMRLSRLKELSYEERDKVLDEVQTADKYVEIISFVLMPNHFHFLLKQIKDNGVSSFISQFTNSYTRYFNTIHERVGPIYQGVFKSVHVETDEQLIHLSRYIHLNPLVSNIVKKQELRSYPWSSFPDFLRGQSNLVWLAPVLEHFSSTQQYEAFVFDHIQYARELERIKHLILED